MMSLRWFDSNRLLIGYILNEVVIARTEALRRLREKLGSPVRNLNTIVIGLHGVGAGRIKKPTDLTVTWNVQDLKRAEAEARGFSIRALMTVACDALDHYMYDLGKLPGPVQDSELISILTRQSQTNGKMHPLTPHALDQLKQRLLAEKDNQKAVKKCLVEFSKRHCGEHTRPSLRARHEKLFNFSTHHKAVQAKALAPSKHYFSAIELLIAWKNELVHDTDEGQLGNDAIKVLTAKSQDFSSEHAGIDINQTIDRYRNKLEPSLKDISTLVSVLLRYVSSIDQSLLSGCNVVEFFKNAITHELKIRKSGIDTLRKWAGKSLDDRIDKARQLVAGHGFVPASFKLKKDSDFRCTASAADLEFLNAQGFEGLRGSLGLTS